MPSSACKKKHRCTRRERRRSQRGECRTARLRCFFFNDTATTEIYTLSLHDALPISQGTDRLSTTAMQAAPCHVLRLPHVSGKPLRDRKSTRLNSSHANISYAVF